MRLGPSCRVQWPPNRWCVELRKGAVWFGGGPHRFAWQQKLAIVGAVEGLLGYDRVVGEAFGFGLPVCDHLGGRGGLRRTASAITRQIDDSRAGRVETGASGAAPPAAVKISRATVVRHGPPRRDFQQRRHGRNGCGPGLFVAGPARATGRQGRLPDRARSAVGSRQMVATRSSSRSRSAPRPGPGRSLAWIFRETRACLGADKRKCLSCKA